MPWLSLPEYSRLTGTPESTVRALIKAGRLEAHREARAPGDPREVWKIMVDDPPDAPTEHPQPSTASERPQPPSPTTDTPAATMRLLDKLDERDATIAALYAENGELREQRGRLTIQVENLTDALEWTQAQLDRERRVWWRKLWAALIGS